MRFLNSALFFCITLSGFAQMASASDILEDRASSFFLGAPAVTLQQAALGKACSGSLALKYEVPCNPAFLPAETTRVFAANVYLGDDYKTIYRNYDLINGENKAKLAQSILDEPDPMRMDAAASIWLRSSWFAVSFTPYRLTYFSAVENRAYPSVSLHGMQERSLLAQLGGMFSSQFHWGLQGRVVDRKFVYEQFDLFDALTDLETHLKVKSQKSIYLEPGAVYYFEGSSWKPRISAMLSNLGSADNKYDETAQTALLDTAFGFQPPLELGTLDFALSYRAADSWKKQEGLRLVSSYQLGLMTAIVGFDARMLNLAVNTGFDSLSVGIMYERTLILQEGGQSYDNAVYTEFRLLF